MTKTEIVAAPKFGRAAEVRAATFDEADNSVEVIWTTGASVRRRDWRSGNYYNEILEVTPGAVRLDRLNAGAPLLDTHDDWSLRSVIGSVVPDSARIDGGMGYARVRLSNAPGDADVVSKIRDGIIRNISVGYAIHRVEKTIKDDGSDEDWRVVDWEPLEISAVPIPADAGSQFRSGGDMPSVEIITTQTEAALPDTSAAESAEITVTIAQEARVADQVIETRAADPVRETSAMPGLSEADVAQRIKADRDAERQRVRAIRELGRDYAHADLADAAIDDGSTVEEFRSALLDALKLREAPSTDNRTRVEVGTEHVDKRAKVMGEALLHRVDPTAPVSDGAREYRGFTLLDLARESLELRGEKTRGMSREEIASRALAQRSGGYHSTSDFPVILGNVINTTLRAGYEAAGQTFRPIVRETTVSDFKAIHRAQLGEGPAFDKVNESGEFKRGTLAEAKESYKIATYGKVIAVTRQVIVNDDMNAFGRVPQLMGGAAAQLESDLVWHAILSNPVMGDGAPLFHGDHKNLPTTAAFSVASLGFARAMMAKQVGLDGKTVLNIRPQYLIVPVALETRAEQELKTVFYPDASDKAATASMRSLQIIAEARIDNGISNKAVGANVAGSATAWYLAASPAQIDTVEIAYLEGNRGVFTESRYGFDVDGLEIKARLDVGAKTLDHRGLLKNVGA
jgi:phage head maturation protease